MITPFEFALNEYGTKEITGVVDNPEVLKYFSDIGFDGEMLKDETAWCSAFVNWCSFKAGYQMSGRLDARSWLNIGCEIEAEGKQYGDLVIFWRGSIDGWKGHVGYYVNELNGVIYTLGGNQGNQVNISGYPKSRVLGYRRLQIGITI